MSGAGFNIAGANHRLYGCKAFGQASAGGGGFYIGGAGRMEVTACEAQDCNGTGGFNVIGNQASTLTGCLADSCAYAGFVITAPQTLVACVVVNRGGSYTTQNAVVLPPYAAAGTYIVKGMLTDRVRRIPVGMTIPAGVGLILDIDNRSGSLAVPYTATVTPDPWLGGDIQLATITGNLTIGNPQSNPANGADGTTAFYQQGQVLTFTLPVDAIGGYTLAFGTSYVLAGGSAPRLAANTVVQISFRYDGTIWREIGCTLDTGWIAVGSFANGWASGGGISYRLIGRIMRLRGTLTTIGTSGATAFTLPAPFVSAAVNPGSATGIASGVPSPVELAVAGTGAVAPTYISGLTALCLDSVTYPVD